MALFEDLDRVNLIPALRRRLDSGELEINLDGKVERKFKFNSEPIWIHARFSEDRECGMWNKVHFDIFRLLPSPCFDCWKVVAKPRNLKDTMEILELQKRMDLPSKVGMEKRDYTGDQGGWSAFWYAPLDGGLEGARKLCTRVTKAVHEEVNPEIRVYLKRACTEMELGFGPSDQWVWDEKYAMVEDVINSHFVHPPLPDATPKFIEVDVIPRWIYRAATQGDLSYLEYKNEPFRNILRSVEYQDSIHNEKDFPLVGRKEMLAYAKKGRKEEKECSCRKEPLICSL